MAVLVGVVGAIQYSPEKGCLVLSIDRSTIGDALSEAMEGNTDSIEEAEAIIERLDTYNNLRIESYVVGE